MKLTVEDRLLAKRVVTESGCWEWQGHRNWRGYGRIKVDNREKATHRLAYTLWVGPIPEGLEIDHLCRNRACFKTDHLEAVDHRTNLLRGGSFAGQNVKKTHCKRGHEFSADNTILNQRGRTCLTCKRQDQRAWKARRRTNRILAP